VIRRLSVAAVAVVLTGTVASGCSTFTNNREAAKAGGASLSVDEFEMILADYAESRSAGADSTSTSVGDTTTTEDPTVPGSEARSLLTEWVTSHLLIAALNKAGAPIDDAARTAATTSLQTSVGAGWDKLDEVTKQFLIEDQAATDALAESPLITDTAVQQAYEAGLVSSNTLCLRLIAFTDQAKANSVYEQLRQGGDFATLADENSADPTTGAGGVFTNSNTGSECSAADQLNETVAQALVLLPLGKASEPLPFSNSDGSTQYVIFMQRPWEEVVAAANPIVREALAPTTAKALIAAGTAHIDSRYGTWDSTTLSVVPTR